MKQNLMILAAIVLGLSAVCNVLPVGDESQAMTLMDFSKEFVKCVEPGPGAKVGLSRRERGSTLLVSSEGRGRAAQVTLKAPAGSWNLKPFLYVTMVIHNPGTKEALALCHIQDARWIDGAVVVHPGESRTLHVLLKRTSLPPPLEKRFYGMNGVPGGHVWIWEGLDLTKVTHLRVTLSEPLGRNTLEIENLRAVGSYAPPSEDQLAASFFPFVDPFGQYRHDTWPGKVNSAEDLSRQRRSEANDLSAHPGPQGWDQFGGWAAGPMLQATGGFRVQKHQGRWWLVDPEGRLFWSHGIDCVRSGNATTPVTDREHYFTELPDVTSPLAKFFGTGRQAARGYYKDHVPYKTYELDRVNLLRKYGESWRQAFADITHKRLRSWGMNTIANWSDENIYLMRKTPYVGTINTGGRPIQGSEGFWRQFPDPFDPAFRRALDQRMAAEKGKSAGDPWCIGYFVDNELSWGDETALAAAALASPADQPAKQELVQNLKRKYANIQALNLGWGTEHDSWEAILESRRPPDPKKAREDLAQFNVRIAEEYFRVCREAIKAAAPEQLYLGCRFDFHFYPEEAGRDWVVRVAAKYCDVISFNRYRFSTRDLTPPSGVDKPLIIGEFHFGALDRGLFHTGLRSVGDQKQRAEMYVSYVRGGLENPFVVGTHWFQYGDQALTGRGDGENYQIGFIDVCDSPYPEIIQASRSIDLYGIRR